MYDGSRAIIPVEEAEIQGAVFRVWVGNDDGVSGIPSTDAAREDSGREAASGDHGPRRRATNLQDGFSNRGGEGQRTVPLRGIEDGQRPE